MTTLEQLARSFARRTTQAGKVVLVTNGHPALVRAFQDLGWSDPYIDPTLLPVVETKATVESTERAVLPRPKGRHG